MNRHMYRLVFNRAHGVLQAVAEIARVMRGAGRGAACTTRAAASTPLAAALALALCALPAIAAPPGISHDRSAPREHRPTVLVAPSGAPVIHITTPSAAGVSRNAYSRFDVDPRGAILNNSRTRVQSEVGGWLPGNPWLARGTARVVLNEVNGSEPSHLAGLIEVAGDRAQVVIANPAGIQADGVGFINANGVVLTTGRPQFGDDGSLSAYRVTRGTVDIAGQGLNALGSGYAQLIARAVALNAALHAEHAMVSLGSGVVTADGGGAHTLAGEGLAPEFALDVGALGGMYANKIRLVGNEHGVGMRNAGVIGAQAGEVVVTLDGRIENTGNVQASDMVRMSAGALRNAGTISAGKEVALRTPGALDNRDGRIDASRLDLDAGHLLNRGGRIAQTSQRALALGAGQLSNREGGRIGAAAPAPARTETSVAEASTPSVPPSGDTAGAPAAPIAPLAPLAHGRLHVTGLLDNDGGTIEAARLSLSLAGDSLDNSGGHLSLESLQLAGGELRNAGGSLQVEGNTQLDLDRIDNRDGELMFSAALDLRAGEFLNRGGRFSHAGQGQTRLRVDGLLDNDRGWLASNAASLSISAARLTNHDGDLMHPGNGTLAISADSLVGDRGRLGTLGILRLQGGALSLRGARTFAQQIDLDADTLDHADGQLSSLGKGQARLRVRQRLGNDGGTLAGNGTLRLHTGQLDNRAGTVEGRWGLTIEADGGMDNQRGRLAGSTLALRAGAIDNRAGLLGSTQGGLGIESDAFDNQGGRVQSADALSLDTRGHALDNRGSDDSGGLRAAGSMAVKAGAVDNRGGTISAAQATMQATQVDNREGGLVTATGAALLTATTLRNGGGAVQAGDRTVLQLTQLLDNRGGLVASGGLLDIDAQRIDNRDTRQGETPRGLQADSLQMRGDALDNSNGLIVATRAAQADTQERSEAKGISEVDARLTLTGAMDNTGGVVSAGDRLAVDADTLHNADGLLHAGRSQQLDMRVLDGAGRLESRGDARLHVRGDFDHSGTIAANGTLTVVADGQLSQRGLLNGGAVAVQARRIDNTASGEIGSQGLTRLEAGEWIRNRGLLDGVTTHLVAPEVDNLGSGRVYGDRVAISATTLRNHDETLDGRSQSGTLAARQRLGLGVQTLHNSGQALIHSGGSAGIGGTLDDARTANGTAARIENIGATIDIAGDLALQAHELHNERPDVRIESQARQEAQVRLDQPTWRHNGENGTRDIRTTSNYQAWEVYYLDPADILEDAPYYTPDGQRIGRAVVRLTPRTSAFFFERGGLHAALGARDRLPPADGTVTLYYQDRRDGQDNPDQVDPGQRDPFAHLTTFNTRPGDAVPTFEYLDQTPVWSNAYGTCGSGCVQLTAQYRYDPGRDLLNPKGASNNKLSGNEQYRTARREVIEDVVTRAGPDAVLQSGGDMHLAVGTLTNLHGRVLAGGVQKIDGLGDAPSLIDNQATTLYRTWTFDVTHHRYDGSTAPGESNPVSEVIGSVGALMGGGQRLDIDGNALRNLDDGRQAPNLRDDLGASNLQIPARGGAPLTGHEDANGIATDAFSAPRFVAAADGSADQVAAGSIDGRLPSASLFLRASEGGAWLIQTDPRFSGPRDWLSSEHQLLALGYNPVDLHKRLGDGYYEQGLVREQITQLTGRRFLEGYAGGEEQFRALLENGATFARQFNLRPGLALTDAQMAALTSDIVWLVEQTITLADGSTTTALVPRVYVRLRPSDLKPSGAVLAADVVKTDLVGDLLNNGTIHGRQLVDLKAHDLNNLGGGITGNFVGLDAARDINNIGGAIRAQHGLVAIAGNDINQVSTTRSEGAGNGDNGYSRNTLDRLATMTVSGANATALIKAGRDYNSQAGQLRNEGGGGQTAILAGRDIKLGTVRVGNSEQARTGKDFSREVHSAEVGSLVQGGGDVVLRAGKDIASTASTVNSENGTLHAEAKGDVLITHGTATDEYESATQTKKKRAFGSKTTGTYDHVTQTTAQGSSWGGNTVVAQGNNVTVQGSTVVSDEGTVLHGRNDVSVVAARNTLETTQSRKVKKSGVFSDGGVGFSIGSQKLATTGQMLDTTHTSSVVGSVAGKTTIYAGGHYQQTGSDVLGGDGVAISGATVAIEDVEDSMAFRETQKTSSGGLHISLKGGAADQAAAAYQGARAAGRADDNRLKALYAMKAAGAASNVNGGAITNQAGNAKDVFNGDSKANSNGMSLRIGIGGSSSSSQSEGNTTTSQGSNIYSANGDVSVEARASDLVVDGSKVEGVNTTLAAADKLILLSGEDGREFREKNKSQSGEVGITLGSEAGFGIYVSAAMAKGKGRGNGTSHDEAVIGGLRGTTTFISGGDTIGKGAQIIGNRVIGQVGGDLLLQSQQDTNEYHRKDVAAGIDAAIGTGGGSVSGYVAASKVDSTYKSVVEQTGVHAGEGGYHINVAGKTTLDGAAIASTADPSNNYFHTGSLEWRDIVNEAKFKATQASVSGGGGSSGGSGSGSFQQKSDTATSITHAGIADGTLVVDDGSGLDIARGVTGLQKDGLKEIFDAREVSEQQQIQQVAGELGFQAAGTLAEENGWAEGSKEKVALHAAVGAAVAALGGGAVLGGAAGAGLNQSLVPVLRNAIEDAGVKESDNPTAFNALMQAASLAVGSVGGASGASTALAGDVYNRQLHPDEIAFLQSKAEEFAAQIYGCQPGTCSPEQIGAARKRLTVEASQRVDGVMTQRIGTSDKEAEAFINANPVKFAWGEGFTATREQYNDFRYFGELLSNDKQSLAVIADALGAAGWTKQDFQQAYNPQLLALANQQRGEDGKAVMEMFSGDVGMGLGIIAKIINGDIKGATADAAIAAIPWGIGKILRPILPVADAGKGLIWVGGKKLDAGWLNEKGELTWINPLTNKSEVFPDAAIFNADHALPRDAIEKIAGFDDLPKRIQNALLEDPRNYQPMVKSANCSKGCKVEVPTGGWVTWNGRLVHPEYKNRLEIRQAEFRKIVNDRVALYRETGR